MQRAKVGIYDGLVCGQNIDKIDQYLSRYQVCGAIDWVVSKFKFRKNDDLELLATVDFACLDLLRSGVAVTAQAVKHIIATNQEWAPKLKREIFSDKKIADALLELQDIFPATYSRI